MERDTGSTFFVYKADVKHLILMLNELLTMEEYTLDDGVSQLRHEHSTIGGS